MVRRTGDESAPSGAAVMVVSPCYCAERQAAPALVLFSMCVSRRRTVLPVVSSLE